MTSFSIVRSRETVISSRVRVLCSETGAGGFPVLNETMKGCSVMRSVFRSVLVALVAVLALSAVAASGASAHSFVVEGKTLTGEEAFTGTSTTAKFVIKIGGAQLAFECTKEAASGDFQGEGKLAHGTLHFSGCVENGSSKCRINEMNLGVEGKLGGQGVEFTGAGTKEELATLKISSCSLSGEYTMSGNWSCELHEESVAAVEHEEICKAPYSHIKFGTEEITLAYKEKVKLVSGKKWSAV